MTFNKIKKEDEEEMNDSLAVSEKESKAIAPADMYAGTVDAGTEEITGEDLNMPVLKIVQANTQDLEVKHEGWFHRSDTGEQMQTVDVNFCYVTTIEQDTYNKTAREKVKVYYGFYAGTTEPFKLYVRGWSMEGHRSFQSQVALWKKKMKVPMFALKVRLSTENVKGVAKDGVTKYSIYKLIFTVLKDEKSVPLIEMSPEHISFLFEGVTRFKGLALTTSENDEVANTIPTPDDLPFS